MDERDDVSAEAGAAVLVDELGRTGLGGHVVAFVHPRSTLGVLTELIEAPGTRGSVDSPA